MAEDDAAVEHADAVEREGGRGVGLELAEDVEDAAGGDGVDAEDGGEGGRIGLDRRLAGRAGQGTEDGHGPHGFDLTQARDGLDQLAAAQQRLQLDGGEDALGGEDDGRLAADERGRAGGVDEGVDLRARFAGGAENLAAGDAQVARQDAPQEVADGGLAAPADLDGMVSAALALDLGSQRAAEGAEARGEAHLRRHLPARGAALARRRALGLPRRRRFGHAALVEGTQAGQVVADEAEGHPAPLAVPRENLGSREHGGNVAREGRLGRRPTEIVAQEAAHALLRRAVAELRRQAFEEHPLAVGHPREEGGELLPLHEPPLRGVGLARPRGAAERQIAERVGSPPEVGRPAAERLPQHKARSARVHRSLLDRRVGHGPGL